MPNTPHPCCDCGWLYADCMQNDNPNYQAECMCRKEDCVFDSECPNYAHWKTLKWTEQE